MPAQESVRVSSGVVVIVVAGRDLGDKGVGQVVVSLPVNIVVGGHKGLGEDGPFLRGVLAGTDTLQDESRFEIRNEGGCLRRDNNGLGVNC